MEKQLTNRFKNLNTLKTILSKYVGKKEQDWDLAFWRAMKESDENILLSDKEWESIMFRFTYLAFYNDYVTLVHMPTDESGKRIILMDLEANETGDKLVLVKKLQFNSEEGLLMGTGIHSDTDDFGDLYSEEEFNDLMETCDIIEA